MPMGSFTAELAVVFRLDRIVVRHAGVFSRAGVFSPRVFIVLEHT